MTAGNNISKTCATCQEHLETIDELKNALSAFLDCPIAVDQATIPKAGVEANPKQVIVNFSCSLIKLRNAEKLVGKTEVL